MQNHFPERLGRAVSYKPPMLFNVLWKAVSPFVDPLTRDKLVFLSPKSPPGGEAWGGPALLRRMSCCADASKPPGPGMCLCNAGLCSAACRALQLQSVSSGEA